MKSVQGKFFTVVLCSLFFEVYSVPLFAWPVENGIAVCTAWDIQANHKVVSDGYGGAIITWQDYRNTTSNPGLGSDIYVQRVNSSGSTLWTLDGVAICTALYDQWTPALISDDSGGAIITWFDFRNGGHYNIYAQRVNSFGSTLWNTNGVVICSAADWQIYPTIARDGLGGAIITWQDYRNGSNYDIYAQRVDVNGVPQWTLNGEAICTAKHDQTYPTMSGDGFGGAIITWRDYRNTTGNLSQSSDIYAN